MLFIHNTCLCFSTRYASFAQILHIWWSMSPFLKIQNCFGIILYLNLKFLFHHKHAIPDLYFTRGDQTRLSLREKSGKLYFEFPLYFYTDILLIVEYCIWSPGYVDDWHHKVETETVIWDCLTSRDRGGSADWVTDFFQVIIKQICWLGDYQAFFGNWGDNPK